MSSCTAKSAEWKNGYTNSAHTISLHFLDVMLCGIAGIEQKTLENSAAYLKTWIARLKSDLRLLVSAASQAQKAADFIQSKAAYQETEAQAA